MTRPPSFGKATPPASSGRSNAPFTSCSEGSASNGPISPWRCPGSGFAVSPSRKHTMSVSQTWSARHIASPLPSAGPYSGSTSSWSITRGAGRPRDVRGSVNRMGIDDHDVVDHAFGAQWTDGTREHAGHRVGALLRRDHHPDRRRPLPIAQPFGRERARHVAPLRRPRRHGQVDRQPPCGAAHGPSGGAHADIVGAKDRDARPVPVARRTRRPRAQPPARGRRPRDTRQAVTPIEAPAK